MKIIKQYVDTRSAKDASAEVSIEKYIGIPRDTTIKSYETFVSGVSDSLEQDSSYKTLLEDFKFVDPCLQLNTENRLSAKSTYYLGFNVRLQTDSTRFKVKLRGSSSSGTLYERLIKNVKISSLSNNTDSTFVEMLFTIHDGDILWDSVVFEYERTSTDFNLDNKTKMKVLNIEGQGNERAYVISNIDEDSTGGWQVLEENLSKDNNGNVIIEKDEKDNSPKFVYIQGFWTPIEKSSIVFRRLTPLISKSNNDYIEHIAIQGKPGSLFVLDEEEFKLGKSGLFEIDYKTLNIKKVSVYKRSDDEFFLIDCKEYIEKNQVEGGQ